MIKYSWSFYEQNILHWILLDSSSSWNDLRPLVIYANSSILLSFEKYCSRFPFCNSISISLSVPGNRVLLYILFRLRNFGIKEDYYREGFWGFILVSLAYFFFLLTASLKMSSSMINFVTFSVSSKIFSKD